MSSAGAVLWAPAAQASASTAGATAESALRDVKRLTIEEQNFFALTPSQLRDLGALRSIFRGAEKFRGYYSLQDDLEHSIMTERGRHPRALIVGANNGILADRLSPIITIKGESAWH